MMIENPIKMEKISNRKLHLEREGDGKNLKYFYEVANRSIECSDLTRLDNVKQFFLECKNKNTANRWYPSYIRILESLSKLSNQKPLEECIQLFVSHVVPFVSEIDQLKEATSQSSLDEKQKQLILSESSEYKICDRIISNHNKLSKRFNLSNYIHERRTVPIDELVYEVCNMIDTYSTIPAYGKMNIALEELSYLFSEHAIDYDKKEFLESLTDYFLSRESNRSSDISIGYCKAINESSFIKPTEVGSVKFLLDGSCPVKDPIDQVIKEYKLEPEKNDEKFISALEQALSENTLYLLAENSNLLKWVKNFLVLPTTNTEIISEAMDRLQDRYRESGLNRRYTNQLINELKIEQKKVNNRMIRCTNESILPNLEAYSKGLNDSIVSLEEYVQRLYTDEEARKHFEIEKASNETITLQEFRLFKFQNLITMTGKVNKMIEKTYQSIVKATKAKLTKWKDKLTESTIYAYITEDCKVDFCVAEFDISEVDNLNTLHEYMTNLCKSFQSSIGNGSIFYYTVLENTCEIRVREKYDVVLNEEEELEKEFGFSIMDLHRCSELIAFAEAMEKLDQMGFYHIMEDLESKMDYITADQLNLFLDFWTCNAIVPTEEMGKFVDTYCKTKLDECCPSDAYKVRRKYEQLTFEPVYDIDLMVESAEYMQQVLSEEVNLNNIRLAIQGVKKKAKDLGAKERELSRDLDAAVNNLVRGAKSFLISDRREAIIKGSIIPSFSKILKIGAGLWAIAVPFQQPVIAAIALIGGLAASKNITKKERMLLLDEIDTELQVVEREIKKAEDQGKSQKKYRALLTYQKNLIRERQRIQYNLNLSGQRLPNASVKGDD